MRELTLKWFSYAEATGFELHGSAIDASREAESALEDETDEAQFDGEWSEHVADICWGQIHGIVMESGRRPADDDSAHDEYVDFELVSVETDAETIAELRAELAECEASRERLQVASVAPSTTLQVWVVVRNDYVVGIARDEDSAFHLLTQRGNEDLWDCVNREADGSSWWQHRAGAKGELTRWEVRDV